MVNYWIMFIFIQAVGADDHNKSYSLHLQPLDTTKQGNVLPDLIPLTKTTFDDSFVAFERVTLPEKRLWNATVVVSGCCQSKLSNYFEISKLMYTYYYIANFKLK